jgi:ABC-type Co2+ transport system permease subunit
LIWDLSSFLIYALMAMNFPLRTPLLHPIGSGRLCFRFH